MITQRSPYVLEPKTQAFVDALSAQRGHDFIQILLAGFDLGSRGERPIDLAGHALFDVQQIQFGLMHPRHGGGVRDGLAVERGVVERNQDPVVSRSFMVTRPAPPCQIVVAVASRASRLCS